MNAHGVGAAEQAADQGMEQALRAQRVADWKQRAAWWLQGRSDGSVFTADDLVAAVGLPDTGPARNNVVGAWISAQAKTGLIEFTGELVKSRRVEGHGNLQRRWRVRGRKEAPAQVPPLPSAGASSRPPSLLDELKAEHPELWESD